MRLAAVLVRDLAGRWKGATVIVVTIFAMMLLGLGVYDSMDLSIYDTLPEALRRIMGIPLGASAEVLAYNEMLNAMGALAAACLGIAVGADVVAGEERRRTLGLLLAQPVSRLAAVCCKALVVVLVVGATTLGLWGGALLSAAVMGAETGDAHLGALCVSLGANALLHGALAFCVATMTGNKSLGAGVASGVLLAGWILAGLLPMWPDYADWARFVPYRWFSVQEALVDGLDAGWLVLQVAVAVALLVVWIVVFPVRDLHTAPSATLAGRLRGLPWPSLGRGPRGASLSALAFARSVPLVWILAATLGLGMGVGLGPVYRTMEPDLARVTASVPAEFMQLFGAGDMSTPEGFFWGETMGLVAPACVLAVAVAVAAGLFAEERDGRLGLVLSTPVGRARVLAATARAMVRATTLVAVATGLGMWGASVLFAIDLDPLHIAGATLHLLALGLAIGAAGLLVGAATGASQVAMWTVVGIGLAGHFGAAMLRLSPDTAWWSHLSPFHYYSSLEPLKYGVDWGHVGILLAAAAVAIAGAFPLYARRDLRA